MPEDFLKIVHDPKSKIWKSVNYPYGDLIKMSVGEQFLKTMRASDPNKIIDHFFDSNTSKTAKTVCEQAILIAVNLQRLGVKRGDVVVLHCMNNEWTCVLTMGCILLGALVNFFEVHMDGDSRDIVYKTLNPTMIIYEEKYYSKIQQSLECCKLKSQLISIDGKEKPNVIVDLIKLPDAPVDFGHFKSVEIQDPQKEIVCLALTSGSTGVPKIVQITHSLLMHGSAIWWENESHCQPLTENSVVFSFSPLRWISQVVVMFESVLFGCKRVSSCGAPTGKYGLNVLRNSGISHIFVAPSIFYEILLQMDENDVESLKSLKYIQLGGEPPSQITMELTKKHAVNAKVFNCYGMTEMCTCISNDELINGGKLLPGYEMQILDDNMQPLGVNQAGQIAIKNLLPLKGYMGMDNKDFLNENGFFINGDYGLIDGNHNLHILARYKDLIRSNGHVIVPNTLEYVIINLPEVYVARLAGYRKTPDDPNETGVFFVVLNAKVSMPRNEISAKIFDTLKGHLTKDELAVIEGIHFVDSVPLTTCGKVDRVALKKLASCLFG